MIWFLFIVAIIAAFVFFKANIRRGRRFVRAYYFLFSTETMGETSDVANELAASLFLPHSSPEADNEILVRAQNYAATNHGGKQLPVIAMAVEKGFEG